MGRCDTCGNEYDKSFEVIQGGRRYTFDSIECAVHMIAPRCAHCECAILGHGVEGEGKIYCCANCAKHDGTSGLRDRV